MDLFQRGPPPSRTFLRAHVRRKCGLLKVIWLAENFQIHRHFCFDLASSSMSIIYQENGKEEKKCLLDNWDDIVGRMLMWNFGVKIFFGLRMEFVLSL